MAENSPLRSVQVEALVSLMRTQNGLVCDENDD